VCYSFWDAFDSIHQRLRETHSNSMKKYRETERFYMNWQMNHSSIYTLDTDKQIDQMSLAHQYQTQFLATPVEIT